MPRHKDHRRWRYSIAAIALMSATPAIAQDANETGDAPPPDAETVQMPGEAGARQIYTPEDFARYAPQNAFDMLVQVPNFNIQGGDNQQRGLGQASGNVLFNGARPSSKSDSIFTQLQRIPADNVTRIEIVDGATLDIPGLSGQVANVIFEATGGISGQFSWMPEFRPYNTDPVLFRGNVSISGSSGEIEYQAGLDNTQSGHGGADGITTIIDGSGRLIETRFDELQSQFNSPKLTGRLTWNRTNGDIGNVAAHYQRIYSRYDELGIRTAPGELDQFRTVASRGDGWNTELSGDYAFDLGPGRFKGFGLYSFNHQPNQTDVITEFADGSTPIGIRFAQTGDLSEQILRGEYTWSMFGGDWQVAAEGAFNTLDNVAGLFVLEDGEFIEQPFPGGTGGVSEDRYEASISFGRSLTDNLSFQLLLAAENSTIATTGLNPLERSFFRPKGQLSFAWNPTSTLDISLKIERRVLQLDFYDFLASANLNDNNENANNNDLRPQQDWSFEGEINQKWGPWGSSQLRFVYRDVTDKVEIVPVANGGEAVGNIPTAWAAAVVFTNTLNLDPIGVAGFRFDNTLVFQTSGLRDPFTGENRQWSAFTDRQSYTSIRHDIPDSDWAWGLGVNYQHQLPRYRRNEVDRSWEGPVFANIFVEHKDVFGLTVRAAVNNFADARQQRYRVVYEGLREASPIAFIEDRDRRIGPIYSFSVRGTF